MGVDVLMADNFITDVSKLNKDIQSVLGYNAQKSISGETMTAEEYLAARGGVNPVTGKYGDSYNPNLDLNDAEYKAAIAGKTGTDAGKAINTATQKKMQAYIAANPQSPEALSYAQEVRAAGIASGGLGTGTTTGTTSGSTTGSTTGSMPGTLTATQQSNQNNAIAFLTSTFNDLGLGSDIANAVTNLVQQGYTADTIQIIAQDPKSKDPLAVAFQQRFPANAQRLAAGLPVLSPSQYIANEQGYAQVMRAYGLNPSFATNKDVFTKLLTNDVSPTELNGRVNTAKQVIENTDPAVAQQLQTYYGLSQGDMIAHVLDPTIATPIIEKQISTSQIGAEAARYGANIGQSYATQLSNLGISQAQAGQGFQNIAQQLPGTQELATRYAGYTPAGQVGSALQAATFGTADSIQAEQELQRLKIQEISQFSGSSGAGKGSLLGSEEGVQ
jgi:hypothetical protein